MSDVRLTQLSDLIQERLAHLHIPGAAIGILDGDEAWAAGFGVTNVEHPLPVTPDTLFQIGSVTKTVTATAAMRLVEAGRLDLDTPVRRYLPELRLADEDTAVRVTARHLLTHTAGWAGDYFDDGGPGDDALANMVRKLAALPQVTPLGRYYSYNNAGFYLAGRLLEVVDGRPYETLARELVLGPLGLERTFYSAAECITHRVAVGHQAVYGESQAAPVVARPWAMPRALNPVGGLNSTVHDVLRYAQFQMGDGAAPPGGPLAGLGQRLLSPEGLRLMHTPAVRGVRGEWVGLSWFIRQAESPAGPVTLIRHGGGTKGQICVLQVAPARRFALVVLTNSGRGDELTLAASRWALEHYLGVIERDPEPIRALPAQLAQYAGRYTSHDEVLELRVEGVDLVVHLVPLGGFPTPDTPPMPAPPPVRAALCGEDELVIVDEPARGQRGEFVREEGRLAWLHMGGRLHKRASDSSEVPQ